MSTSTKIEWTRSDDGTAGATWNPVTGCSEVSEGCDNCYAKTFAERWRGIPGHPFEQGFEVRLWPERIGLPLRWRKPRRVFVNSMSDLFHKDVPDGFVARVFAVMVAAPAHTFQVLTKRHARMRSLLSNTDFWTAVSGELAQLWAVDDPPAPLRMIPPWIWIGVSVDNQKWADTRIPALLDVPAAVRFLSCEPLLGPVDLSAWMPAGYCRWRCSGCRRFYSGEWQETCPGCGRVGYWSGSHPGNQRPNGQPINWVICGGESGRKARPMHPDWARSLRDQCQAARVPYFFKQWGAHAPESARAWTESDGTPRGAISFIDTQGRSWTRTPKLAPSDAVRMRRVGKGRAGRELDGQTWDEFPQAVGGEQQ